MQDIAGCRLVVQDVLEQNRVVDRLQRTFAKAIVVDRRKQPSYGYRAVHIIAMARNKQIEIQIRSALQHLWAQLSEKVSDVHGLEIKYGGGESRIRNILSNNSKVISSIEDFELQPGTVGQPEETARAKEALRKVAEDMLALAEAVLRTPRKD
jgi:putative GTP pyrophosphokinase